MILRSVQSCGMMVTDLYHFLDLPEDTPGPARRLAQHLDNIVRAATAGDAGIPWISALPCRPASPAATVPCDERFTARVAVLRALDRGRPALVFLRDGMRSHGRAAAWWRCWAR